MENFETYKVEKYDKELAAIPRKHGLQTSDLKNFVSNILSRMIFDGEKLYPILMEPLELSWKERRQSRNCADERLRYRN